MALLYAFSIVLCTCELLSPGDGITRFVIEMAYPAECFMPVGCIPSVGYVDS